MKNKRPVHAVQFLISVAAFSVTIAVGSALNGHSVVAAVAAGIATTAMLGFITALAEWAFEELRPQDHSSQPTL